MYICEAPAGNHVQFGHRGFKAPAEYIEADVTRDKLTHNTVAVEKLSAGLLYPSGKKEFFCFRHKFQEVRLDVGLRAECS